MNLKSGQQTRTYKLTLPTLWSGVIKRKCTVLSTMVRLHRELFVCGREPMCAISNGARDLEKRFANKHAVRIMYQNSEKVT